MSICRSCKSENLVIDDVTGNTFCSSCGIIQDFDNYHVQFGGISGPQGTFVRLGTVGSGTDYSYKERKFFESNRIIEDITFRLNFADQRTREVKSMVEKVTDGEFGLGNWFSVLVGASCYIVMRQCNKSLPISEVVGVVGCEFYELGRMVNRVLEFLGLELPEFNVVGLFERMVGGFSGFRGVDEDKLDLMIKQGTFVVQCAIKWFLTTGRRPGPVAVAVLVFVAELNEVEVRIEDVAKEVNLAIRTCRMRYKELLEALVEVARGLPWGKDVNVKNIVRNAPFVMTYMEMKSMQRKGVKRTRSGDEVGRLDLDNIVQECLSREVCYRIDYENDLGQNKDDLSALSTNDLQNLKVSYEDLSRMYSKFKADVADRALLNVTEGGHYGDRLKGRDLGLFDEWWSGRSELSKRLQLEQLLEKDVGLEALPPSYIRGCEAVERRREKIRAAKMRIRSIACPQNDDVDVSSDVSLCSNLETQPYSGDALCSSDYDSSYKKRRKQYDDIDWEDFIIQTLLLHQVKEAEIEKGHYKALLGVHVFKSGFV